jgi:hypothetical protein
VGYDGWPGTPRPTTGRHKDQPLTSKKASSILHRFRQHLAGRYTIIEITPALFDEAIRLANTHALRARWPPSELAIKPSAAELPPVRLDQIGESRPVSSRWLIGSPCLVWDRGGEEIFQSPSHQAMSERQPVVNEVKILYVIMRSKNSLSFQTNGYVPSARPRSGHRRAPRRGAGHPPPW